MRTTTTLALVALAMCAFTGGAGAEPTGDTATVSGRIWFDRDQDQVQDAGEAGYTWQNAIVLVRDGQVVAATTPDAEGDYAFDGLEPGAYRIGNGESDRFAATTPSTVDLVLAAGEHAEADFGIKGALVTGIMAKDTDANGVLGPNDPRLADKSVRLTGPAGLALATTTDVHGNYSFDDLPRGGQYVVTAPDLTAERLTYGPRGEGVQVNPGTGRSDPYFLGAGASIRVGIGYVDAPTTSAAPTTPTTPSC